MKLFSYEYAASSWPRLWLTLAMEFLQNAVVVIGGSFFGLCIFSIGLSIFS